MAPRALVALGVFAAGCSGAAPGLDSATLPRFPRPALSLEWRRDLLAGPMVAWNPIEHATPAIDSSGDRLFLGASDGYVRALHAGDGSTIWAIAALGAAQSEPVYDPARGVVYFGSDGGVFYAVRALDGEVLWRRSLRGLIRQPPILEDEVLYVAAGDDTVHALARSDGRVLWRYRREPREGFGVGGYAGLARVGANLVTGFSDGTIAALAPADGTIVWEHDTTDDIEDTDVEGGPAGRLFDVDTTPVVRQGVVYASSFVAGVYALDGARGRVVWRRGDLAGVTSLAIAGDLLIAGSSTAGVVAVEATSGATVWQRSVHRGAPGPAVVAGRIAIVGLSGAGLAVYRIATGELLQAIDTGRGVSALPAVWGDRLFVVSNTGALFAFRIRR